MAMVGLRYGGTRPAETGAAADVRLPVSQRVDSSPLLPAVPVKQLRRAGQGE